MREKEEQTTRRRKPSFYSCVLILTLTSHMASPRRTQSASSGSAGSRKRSGRRRRTRWVPRGNWVSGRSYRCSYPRPLSWHPQTRIRMRGWATLSLVSFLCHTRSTSSFPLSFPWCARYLLGSGRAEGKRGACNVPPPRRQRTGGANKMYAAIV